MLPLLFKRLNLQPATHSSYKVWMKPSQEAELWVDLRVGVWEPRLTSLRLEMRDFTGQDCYRFQGGSPRLHRILEGSSASLPVAGLGQQNQSNVTVCVGGVSRYGSHPCQPLSQMCLPPRFSLWAATLVPTDRVVVVVFQVSPPPFLPITDHLHTITARSLKTVPELLAASLLLTTRHRFAVFSALGRWRQEDQEVKARLS